MTCHAAASMLTAVASVLMVLCGAVAPQPRTVPLANAAESGMTIPLAGLGMPCGLHCPAVCPGYKCSQSSYDATLTFLALGGRHTDSADSCESRSARGGAGGRLVCAAVFV